MSSPPNDKVIPQFKEKHGIFQQFKAGFKGFSDKLKGRNSSQSKKRNRNAQEILEDIKPHFVKTLTATDGEEAKSMSRGYRQQQTEAAEIEGLSLMFEVWDSKICKLYRCSNGPKWYQN